MDFRHLLGLHDGSRTDYYVVCNLDPPTCQLIGAHTSSIFLSYETIQKQIKSHPEMTLNHYRALRPCLKFGEYWHIAEQSLAVFFVDTYLFGTNFRAILKSAACGTEIFLTSFHMVRDSKIRQHRRSLIRNKKAQIKPHAEI